MGPPGHCAVGAIRPPHRRRACVPFVLSAASATALRARTRLQGWFGGRQPAAQLEQWLLGMHFAGSPPSAIPLCSFPMGEMRIKVGWEYPARCTRDCTRRFVPLLLLFSFSQSEIGFASPYRSSPFIVDTPEGRGCCALQAAATTFVIKPPYWCRRLFRRWRHSPPVFVKQALDPPSRLEPFSHEHRRRCS